MGATELVKAASEPIVKLIDAVSGAIGKAYEPRYIRRMADAKAYEIRRISDALRNNSDLPIVYTGNQTNVDISDFNSLKERTGYRLAYQEIRKQENIEAVVEKACEEVDGKEVEVEGTVDPDWMNRFISEAGEVSDEEMQKLWAKVLAGEVIHPRSFSLKTLDCVRNMTASDAELFTKLSQYIIQNRFISNNTEILKKCGLTYTDILQLDECGLINSSGFISADIVLGSEQRIVLDFDTYILMGRCIEGGNQKISIGQHPLTRAGKELCKIARRAALPNAYINDVVEIVKREANRSSITLHKINYREDESLNYKLAAIDQLPVEET